MEKQRAEKENAEKEKEIADKVRINSYCGCICAFCTAQNEIGKDLQML